MPITDQIQMLTPSQMVNRQMRVNANQILLRAIQQYNTALENFWKHPTLSPQQVSDALGTDASDYFQFYGKLRAFILAINPNAPIAQVSNYGTFTVNGDGTVTINSVN